MIAFLSLPRRAGTTPARPRPPRAQPRPSPSDSIRAPAAFFTSRTAFLRPPARPATSRTPTGTALTPSNVWGAVLICVRAAVAGGTTFAAAAGSYTLTGASAGLAGKAIADAGSYAITGFSATLAGKALAAAGSYAITGSAATFAFKFTAEAAVSSEGTDPTARTSTSSLPAPRSRSRQRRGSLYPHRHLGRRRRQGHPRSRQLCADRHGDDVAADGPAAAGAYALTGDGGDVSARDDRRQQRLHRSTARMPPSASRPATTRCSAIAGAYTLTGTACRVSGL